MTYITLDDILIVLNHFVSQSGKPIVMSKEKYNALLEMVNLDYLDYRYSKWEESRDESDDLRFLKDVNASETVTAGVWTLPTTAGKIFYRLSSVTVNGDDGYVACDIVTDMELAERLADSLTQPTATFPVCAVNSLTLDFYPTSITSANINYIRYPTTPEYKLKKINGINVYDTTADTGSVDFEWPDSCAPDLIRLMLGYMDIVVDKRAVLEQIKRVEGDK